MKKNPKGPTIKDHPGLDSDEATDAGKMMTASGSDAPPSEEGRKPEPPLSSPAPGR